MGYWNFDKSVSAEKPAVVGDRSQFHHATAPREWLVPSSVLLSPSSALFACEDYALC